MNRRDFIKTSAAAAALTAIGAESSPRLIDVNVHLSHWPARRVRNDDTESLAAKLRANGVTQAWAGSFDALLHKDLAAVNARLAADCRGFFIPFGSINPKLPDWEEEFRRCVEVHKMPGLRLYPNYHGYKLDDPNFARLLGMAAEKRLIVQLAVIMEDERLMHPLLQVAPVDTAPLPSLVKKTPSLRLVLLNSLGVLRAKPLLDLIASGEVSVEISMLEGVGGIGNLLNQIPTKRLLFGSHSPLFYFESALLKLQESPIKAEQLSAIRSQNARQLLGTQIP